MKENSSYHAICEHLTINKQWACRQHIIHKPQNINCPCYTDSHYPHLLIHLLFHPSTPSSGSNSVHRCELHCVQTLHIGVQLSQVNWGIMKTQMSFCGAMLILSLHHFYLAVFSGCSTLHSRISACQAFIAKSTQEYVDSQCVSQSASQRGTKRIQAKQHCCLFEERLWVCNLQITTSDRAEDTGDPKNHKLAIKSSPSSSVIQIWHYVVGNSSK